MPMFINIRISESEIYHFTSSLHLIDNVVVSFGSRDVSTSQCLLHDVVDQDWGQDSLHLHLQSEGWREAVWGQSANSLDVVLKFLHAECWRWISEGIQEDWGQPGQCQDDVQTKEWCYQLCPQEIDQWRKSEVKSILFYLLLHFYATNIEYAVPACGEECVIAVPVPACGEEQVIAVPSWGDERVIDVPTNSSKPRRVFQMSTKRFQNSKEAVQGRFQGKQSMRSKRGVTLGWIE